MFETGVEDAHAGVRHMKPVEPSNAEIEQSIASLLREEEIATLATQAADGFPSASTMHVAGDGLKVYLHTFGRTRKHQEMLANPKVSYVVSHLPPGGYDERSSTRSLQVKGCAELVTDRGEIEHAIELSRVQFSWSGDTSLYDNVKEPGSGQQAFFRVVPKEAIWSDHRVRMMWRVALSFDANGEHVAAVRP